MGDPGATAAVIWGTREEVAAQLRNALAVVEEAGAPPVEIARRLVTDEVRRIFLAEIANEDAMRREAEFKGRDDEIPPAANLSTVIDSIRQGLPICVDGESDEEIETLHALLSIRDLLPGSYEVRNLL